MATDQPQADAEHPQPGPCLNVLRGSPSPRKLGVDLASLLRLPERVKSAWPELVKQLLPMPRDDRVLTRLKRAARELEVDPALLTASTKACLFLLTLAAQNNTSRAAFLADVRALAPEELFAGLQALVLPLYDEGFPVLRDLFTMRTVAEHGRVVQNIAWRLEVVKASQHALALSTPITSLSFDYLEGQTQRHITLQLLPEQLVALRQICNEILVDGV